MKELFFNWVFHFNPYTNQWAAIPRELYNDYWNNYELERVIKSNKFSIKQILHDRIQ